MKHFKRIAFLFIIGIAAGTIFYSCDEEVMNYEYEYSELFAIQLDGQIGDAVIDYENNEVYVQVYSEDYSSVALADLVTSTNASTTYSVGDAMDFSISDSLDFTINAEVGESSKTFNIKMTKFTAPPFVGDWVMPSGGDRTRILLNHCDDAGDCSKEKVIDLVSSTQEWYYYWGWWPYWSCEGNVPVCYNNFDNAAATTDNTLAFTMEGVNEEMKMYGSFTHGAGADGQMGSYEHTHAVSGTEYDFNANFEIPASGTWELDLATQEVAFLDDGGNVIATSYTNNDNKSHWNIEGDETEKFTLWLNVNRSGMLEPSEAKAAHGTDDPMLSYIMGSYAIEYRMIRP